MSEAGIIAQPAAPTPLNVFTPWVREAREMMLLGLPIVATQLGQVAIMVTDVVMTGWLSPTALAAAGLAANIWFALWIFAMGVVSATAPMAAQAIGYKKHYLRETRRSIRQGLWGAALLTLPAALLILNLGDLLVLFGQKPELIGPAVRYADIAVWAFFPALIFVVLRNFISALERPLAAMLIVFVSVPLNALTNWCLIFGNLGAPALGIEGAAVATVVTHGFSMIALIAVVLVDRQFRRFHLFGRLWRPDWVRLWELFRIGVPIGATLLLEIGLFSGAIMLMGLIGTHEVAAHQIALMAPAITFMIPMGLAQAATIRVGLAVGRGSPLGVHHAGWTAIAMGAVFMACMTVLMWLFPEPIVRLFLLDISGGERAAVAAIAVEFIIIAALFQVFDGVQAIGAGALRGMKDTTIPMLGAAVSYWAIGFASSYVFGFELELGGVGIWIGLALGLAAAAVFMTCRFTLRGWLGLFERGSRGLT